MKARHVILCAVFLGIGGATGVFAGGGGIHTMMSYFLCIWIAAPALIMLAIMGIERLLQRERSRVMDGYMAGCAALTFGILGFAGGGQAIFHYRESEVRRFVARTLPLLDAHKSRTGTYPIRLEELTDRKIPYYLRGRGRYVSNGSTFSFYYENPDSVMGGMVLSNSDRVWSRAD